MPDREKVIGGLRQMLIHYNEMIKLDGDTKNHVLLYHKAMVEDALALLKEQEAITIKKTKEHGFGVYGGICPKCRNWIQSAHSYCGFCGQAVKWE